MKKMKNFYSGKLLIRLDDACPTNNKIAWTLLEQVFEEYSIKPIVAVIPNCKDANLSYSNKDELFWERVRKYQKAGYTIGMHGYEHKINNTNASRTFSSFNKLTEFAGLPLGEQREKIRKAYSIMLSNDVNPTIWVAPFHTFDHNTLHALLEETPIRIISDGIALFPYNEDGFLWIPQQLGKLRKLLFGIWTICIHPDKMTENECVIFSEKIKIYRNYIITLDDILSLPDITTRDKSWIDFCFEKAFLSRRKFKKL